MKIIGSITLIILVGGAFLISKQNPPIVDGEIIDKKGVHWHPKLAIYVKGEKQELEDGIGLGAKHEYLHTHTEDYKDGVVHIEKQGVVTKDDIKLGNFFKIWGKDINANGNYKMYVNGVESTELDNYLMRDKDLIEIKYE
jgi:hypothetical protein